jgi:hypothetical protein
LWETRELVQFGCGGRFLFIYGLFNDDASSLDYTAANDRMDNKLKRILKEAVVAYLRYYAGICFTGLRKTTENCNQDSPGRDLNLVLRKYEAGVLTTQPRHSVCEVESGLCLFRQMRHSASQCYSLCLYNFCHFQPCLSLPLM